MENLSYIANVVLAIIACIELYLLKNKSNQLKEIRIQQSASRAEYQNSEHNQAGRDINNINIDQSSVIEGSCMLPKGFGSDFGHYEITHGKNNRGFTITHNEDVLLSKSGFKTKSIALSHMHSLGILRTK